MRAGVYGKALMMTFLAAVFLATGTAFAGQGGPAAASPGNAEPQSFRAVRAATTVVLDGRLDEEAWALASPAGGFLQRRPDDSAGTLGGRAMTSSNRARALKRAVCAAFLGAMSVAGLAQVPRSALDPEDSNEARLNRLQPPDQVMDAIGVAPGMTIAEIGAGRGRYVMHLANRVGPQGKVYAEDIDAAALRHLRERCDRWHVQNVEAVLGDVTDPKLPAGTLDLIFIISSYHHFEDPVKLLRNARPALKPTGVLAIGEWLPAGSGSEYVTPDRIVSQMGAAGFQLVRVDSLLKGNGMNLYIFKLAKPVPTCSSSPVPGSQNRGGLPW